MSAPHDQMPHSPSTPPQAEGSARRDPVIEAYKRDIDRSLLRDNLRKTPEERVLALVALQQLAAEAQRAGKACR